MKHKFVLALLAFLAVSFAAPPVVANVQFRQTGPGMVEITYDLSDPDGDNDFTVTFDVSTDGGSTFGIKPKRYWGAAGTGIKAGAGKKIVWDALGDCGRLQDSDIVVRIKADDGRLAPAPPPEKPKPKQPTQEQPKPESENLPAGMEAIGSGEYRWTKDNSVMVKVPAGTFRMGSTDGDDDEKPPHDVYLSEFYIDKYEVTNRQYKQFCDATGRAAPSDPGFTGMPNYFTSYPSYPVACVSWTDAEAYATWAGKSLPTEAQWEEAARGTDGRKYPWGNEEPDAGGFYRANYSGTDSISARRDGFRYTSPVGSYERGKSPYGCYDMAGNVWEWCQDWYDESYYGRSSGNDPTGPSSGSSRVLRGGSWINYARYLRCANRGWNEPAYRLGNIGFRCAR
jgi:formylglycine-generating enzyme required for sulfatase activity